MIDRFFQQPTWPVAIGTLLAVVLTAALQFVLYRRGRLFAEALQAQSNDIADRDAEAAASLAESKRIELAGIATARLAVSMNPDFSRAGQSSRIAFSVI